MGFNLFDWNTWFRPNETNIVVNPVTSPVIIIPPAETPIGWQYKQSTGTLTFNGVYVATGYSGHGEGINNPNLQNVPNVGPCPQGKYTIGPPHNPIDILGPLALELIPDPANEMFGRSAFYIHGDNSEGNKSASDGCIIMPPSIRTQINNNAVKTLSIIA